MAEGVSNIEGLCLVGDPKAMVVCFRGVNGINIYSVVSVFINQRDTCGCEIENFVETGICKPRLILRSRVRRGVYDLIRICEIGCECSRTLDLWLGVRLILSSGAPYCSPGLQYTFKHLQHMLVLVRSLVFFGV